MTSADVQQTKIIANLRIHVERAIGRLKFFRLLTDVLTLSMLPLADDIVIVCSSLCNLKKPLMK